MNGYCLAAELAECGVQAVTASDLPSLLGQINAARQATVLLNTDTRDSATLLALSLDLDPKVKVIVFNLADDEETQIVSCVESGVAAMLLKSESFSDLLALVRAVDRGESRCSAKVSSILLRRVYSTAGRTDPLSKPNLLTSREKDVLDLIERGLTNQQIASQMNLTLYTVKNHVHSLLTKLGVASRSQAATVYRLSRYSQGDGQRSAV